MCPRGTRNNHAHEDGSQEPRRETNSTDRLTPAADVSIEGAGRALPTPAAPPRGEVTPATAWTGRKHAQERSRAQKGRLLNYCPDVTHPEQTAGGCPGLARGWEWGWGAAQGGKTQP